MRPQDAEGDGPPAGRAVAGLPADTRGITAFEYGLIGGVITIALASTPYVLGLNLSARFVALNGLI